MAVAISKVDVPEFKPKSGVKIETDPKATAPASLGMDDEATAVRRKRDASINVAMDLVKKKEALAVYSAGNSGAVMASAIFRLGRLKGIDRPAIGALGLDRLAQAPRFALMETRAVGADILHRWQRRAP